MYQFLPVLIVAALCVCAPFSIEAAQDSTRSGQKPASVGHSESADDKLLDDVAGAVEQAVIHPFQSANVGSEVGGVVQTVLFHEGDRVNQGDVVAVMFDERELIQVRKVREKLTGLRLELKKAEIDLKIKEELVALGVATRLELEKAVSEAEVAAQRIRETSEELLAAEINLKACNIRAPFTGYVAVRYKQPFETVERLEKVFAVLDASKVYAVANVPEAMISKFRKDSPIVFVHSSGRKYRGTVDRWGKLVDPKSLTRRVHVLIDNGAGEIEIGTTGSLETIE